MIPNVDIVLFGIKAGIRLGVQISAAYVDNLKRRELVLPLPNFPAVEDEVSALYYFEGSGSSFLGDDPALTALVNKAAAQTLSDTEKERFILYHQEMRALSDANAGKYLADGVTPEDMIALTHVRQWQNNEDPNPTALKRVSGTLIETAIDYFNKFPAVIDDNTVHGKALRGFLSAIDDVDFVNVPVSDIATDLMVAAIETLNSTPELLVGDDKSASFIEKATRDICQEIGGRIEEIRAGGLGDLSAEDNIRSWGLLVFRSVLKTAAPEVLKSPDIMLDESESSLTKVVGSSILKLVLTKVESSDGNELSVESLFSRQSLDVLAQTVFSAIADNYNQGADNSLVENIMITACETLAETSFKLSADTLPEMISEIVAKSLDEESIFKNNPEILPQLLNNVLLALTGDNRFKFGRSQILKIASQTLYYATENAEWLKSDKQKKLSDMAVSAVGLMTGLKSEYCNSSNLLSILDLVVNAASTNAAWQKLSGNKMLIEGLLEAVVENLSGDSWAKDVKWLFSDKKFLPEVVRALIGRFSQKGVSEDLLNKLPAQLKDILQDLSGRGTLSLDNLLNEIKKL